MPLNNRGVPGLAELQEQLDRKRKKRYQHWLLAKQTVWLTLLTVAFLIYYLTDILQQSMDLVLAQL